MPRHPRRLALFLTLTMVGASLGMAVFTSPVNAQVHGRVTLDAAATAATQADVAVDATVRVDAVLVPPHATTVELGATGVAAGAAEPEKELPPPVYPVSSSPEPGGPSPACTAWWAIGGAPGGGAYLGATGAWVDEQALFGAELGGAVSLDPHVALDFGFRFLASGKSAQRDVAEYALLAGARFYLNPHDSFRVYVPVIVGFVFDGLHERRTDDRVWSTHFGANAGIGLQIHLFGPVLFEVDARAELRQRLDADQSRVVGLAHAGVAVLF